MFIVSTIPVGRYVQKTVYQHAGKSFFTYTVLFVIGSVFVATLYFLIVRLNRGWLPQYVWIVLCAATYAIIIFSIKEHPEEAVHFLEFGLLTYFLFRALSHKIRDWTVYPTTVLFVLLAGMVNEFLQWLTPGRFWGFSDIGFDTLSGCIFVVGIWKGIQPQGISRQVRKASVKTLVDIITLDLILLGVFLSNTPDAVHYYTGIIKQLSWLRAEEHMSELRHPLMLWGAVLVLIVGVRTFGRQWKRKLE